MDKKRLHQLVDLVLDCEHWGLNHRASITVDNDGDHTMTIHFRVGDDDSDFRRFYCDTERRDTYSDFYNTLDPNFDAAEARIRGMMEEIKHDTVRND